MGTRSRLLAFALSLPGAFEDHPWGDTVVKVGRGRGKVFVFLGSESDPRLTVKLDESHGHALALDGARPAGYGLGPAGWVTLSTNQVAIKVLRDFVEESYRLVAPKRLAAELDSR